MQWVRRQKLKIALGAMQSRQSGDLIASGFVDESLGIGRAAQMTIRGLDQIGFEPKRHDIRALLERKPEGGMAFRGNSHGVWIMHCNAPEAVAALSRLSQVDWLNRYRIGYWAYELPQAPKSWIETTRFFDEIWAPSEFVAAAFENSYAPVKVVPHLIEEPDERLGSMRNLLGVDEHSFVVGAACDLRSSLDRKNLLGAVSIFQKASHVANIHADLVIKVTAADADATMMAELEAIATHDPRIVIVRENLSDAEMQQLRASWDLFLSPHRSEGFGMLIAETMRAGKPVLATGWSGNLQFMRGQDAMLIDYKLVPVTDRSRVYNSKQLWAEPDEADAVKKLARFMKDRQHFNEMGDVALRCALENNAFWSAGQFQFAAWRQLLDAPSTMPASD